MQFFKKIQKSLQCCLHCGRFQCNPSQFCSLCEYHLLKTHPWLTQFVISENLVRGSALFSWYPDQDRKVSKLMLALKGGGLPEAFRFYAEIFASRISPDAIPERAVLVPCPNLSQRRHSHQLAMSFSKVLQIPYKEVLTPKAGSEPKIEQKTKKKRERMEIPMQCSEDLTEKHVIFIDDIVTTGATAQSARKAVRSSLGFEVWCLAQRRQLATELGF